MLVYLQSWKILGPRRRTEEIQRKADKASGKPTEKNGGTEGERTETSRSGQQTTGGAPYDLMENEGPDGRGDTPTGQGTRGDDPWQSVILILFKNAESRFKKGLRMNNFDLL